MKKLNKFFLVTLVLLLAACAHNQSYVERGYDTLATMNTAVDRAMEHLGDKYQQGDLSEKQKEEIDKAYRIYRDMADIADSALANYAETKNQAEKITYIKALETMRTKKQAIIGLANSLMGGNDG